jgi:hypothetical protein
MEAFALLSGDGDVTEMAKRMSSRSVNAGQVIIGTMHIKRIQAHDEEDEDIEVPTSEAGI